MPSRTPTPPAARAQARTTGLVNAAGSPSRSRPDATPEPTTATAAPRWSGEIEHAPSRTGRELRDMDTSDSHARRFTALV